MWWFKQDVAPGLLEIARGWVFGVVLHVEKHGVSHFEEFLAVAGNVLTGVGGGTFDCVVEKWFQLMGLVSTTSEVLIQVRNAGLLVICGSAEGEDAVNHAMDHA